jgi:serine/threonine protein kinase
VLVKGEPLARASPSGGHVSGLSSGAVGGAYEPLGPRHVWWLCHVASGLVVAAYHDVERGDLLREMTLPKCVAVWGLEGHGHLGAPDAAAHNPAATATAEGSSALPSAAQATRGGGGSIPPRTAVVDGTAVAVPSLPPKYEHFLKARGRMFREIKHMAQLSPHPNVLKLDGVLEMVHDSKTTLFLVLELAKGGELFDRIALDEGADEASVRTYFLQLLQGVAHCHDQGVCHRDLVPARLLFLSAPPLSLVSPSLLSSLSCVYSTGPTCKCLVFVFFSS